MVQDIAIGLLLLPGVGDRHSWFGRDLLGLAGALALVSAAQYLLDSHRPVTSRDAGPLHSTGRVG